ncbi:hypothetical protein KY345_00420 [Candidatus Woesearchaeota archaeon]|nr:hypothetical protein [Candidatus Woesearchaeota archaeon]
MRKLILFLAVLVLLTSSVFSLDLRLYSSEFNIIDNKVVVETGIILNEKSDETLEFMLPEDYTALSLYIDEKPVSPDVEDNILSIGLDQNQAARFNYVTEEFIDKTNFLMNLRLKHNIERLVIKLVLPEGATLKKPITEGDLTTGSIYPKPTKAATDGRSLIFYWEKENILEGDEINIFAQIEPKQNFMLFFSLAALIIIFLLLLLIIFAAKKQAKQFPKIEKEVIVEKEDMVEKHLKEDEEQIVNILKSKEGSCEQGTIRVITGFSKATLSRLLKELEDRKVIYKEQRGKKNLVFLKK